MHRWVCDKFGHPFEVAITDHEEIPGTAAGIFEDFISEVGEIPTCPPAASVAHFLTAAYKTAGSGLDSPLTAILATLPVTANSHPGNLG